RPHQLLIEIEIVQGIEPCRQNLSGDREMAKIGAGEMATGITRAPFLNWPRVGRVFGPTDIQLARSREQRSVTGIARWQYTVEHIKPQCHIAHQLFGQTNAHEVARPFLWKELHRVPRDLVSHYRTFSDAEPTNRISWKVQPDQFTRTLLTQVGKDSSLHNRKEDLVLPSLG